MIEKRFSVEIENINEQFKEVIIKKGKARLSFAFEPVNCINMNLQYVLQSLLNSTSFQELLK